MGFAPPPSGCVSERQPDLNREAAEMATKLNSLQDLYVEELRDLYSAETQIVKALPKMAKAATNAELRGGFEQHLEQTKGHVQRLEQIFKALGQKPSGTKARHSSGGNRPVASSMATTGRPLNSACVRNSRSTM